jgi:membrane protein
MKKIKDLAKAVFAVIADAGGGWSSHKAPRLGAALAYYTVFSIGPLLLISVAIAGVVFGAEAASNQIYETLHGLVGEAGATVVQDAVKNADKPDTSVLATILGIASLLFGASGVFGELHDALNTVWGVKAKELKGLRNIVGILKERLLSFSMVLGTGFLLLVSLVVTSVLSVVGKWLSSTLPGGEVVWQIINFIIAQAVITSIFAAIFLYVPDVRMRWREGVIAGFVTAIMFNLGKLAIGVYIGKADLASTYGAAGSLIVLLVWIYYSSQILYFGAEMSRALAHKLGTQVTPRREAATVIVDPSVPAAEPQPGQPKPKTVNPTLAIH